MCRARRRSRRWPRRCRRTPSPGCDIWASGRRRRATSRRGLRPWCRCDQASWHAFGIRASPPRTIMRLGRSRSLRCHPPRRERNIRPTPEFIRSQTKSTRGGPMNTTLRVTTFAASCLMAGLLGVNFEAAAPAAAQGAEPVSKTCRVGPRSREVPIQKTEPFKMFDNLYHVGPCYVASWVLTTPQATSCSTRRRSPSSTERWRTSRRSASIRGTSNTSSSTMANSTMSAARSDCRNSPARASMAVAGRLEDDRRHCRQARQPRHRQAERHAEARHGNEGRRYARRSAIRISASSTPPGHTPGNLSI